MACKGCGGNRPRPTMPNTPQAQASGMSIAQQDDANFVRARYNGRNRGRHPVVGPNSKIHYGYRSGGTVFLVHKDDVSKNPGAMFTPVSADPIIKDLPRVAPPAPRRVNPIEVKIPANQKRFDEALQDAQKSLEAPPVLVQEIQSRDFDLGAVPGVTPAIKRNMEAAGLSSPQAILDAGEKGLKKVKLIGATKATLILEYVKERYDD